MSSEKSLAEQLEKQTPKLLKYIDKDVVVTCVHGDKTDIESEN